MFVRQTNQYLKDKRKSFTLQFTPCQFRSHIPSVMPRKSSIRVLSGIDDAFHKRRNCSHQCGCTIRNDFTLPYMKGFKKFLDENSLNADKHDIDSAIVLLSRRVFN
ncbi:hypothetical protein QLX08_008299 [Tetragonisca angustula]|uniref:Uncharacterized protein n=1 Tax=Tetragonisca angustula TaxID=166442 RepID=A0AAW0ZL31_9HYME